MEVLICGHWQTQHLSDLYLTMARNGIGLDGQGCEDQAAQSRTLSTRPNTAQAHEAIGRGIHAHTANVTISTMPFGQGQDFVAACALASPDALIEPIPLEMQDAYELGQRVSCAIRAGQKVILEGGHNLDVTLWASFLEGSLGREKGAILRRTHHHDQWECDEETARDAIGELYRQWGSRLPIFACSTQRPLVGLSSVMAVDRDLATRQDIDPSHAFAVRRIFLSVREGILPSLNLTNHGATDPASLPGAGAGGGIAALMATLGAPLHETGQYLSSTLNLVERMKDTDLVVVTEPALHSPALAQACMDSLTTAAAQWGIPVVAIALDSSLSRHELAQWGLHGALLTADTAEALEHIGQRLAHTWLREGRRH